MAADMSKGMLDEFPHRMRFAGRQDIIVGLVLLKDAPHSFDIVAGVAPIALGIEVAEVQALL